MAAKLPAEEEASPEGKFVVRARCPSQKHQSKMLPLVDLPNWDAPAEDVSWTSRLN